MALEEKTFTYVLTNASFTVVQEYGITKLGMVLRSGTGRFFGTLTLPPVGATPAIPSAAIELVVDQPVTIISPTNAGMTLSITADAASNIEIVAQA